jgi:hypothetical protein
MKWKWELGLLVVLIALSSCSKKEEVKPSETAVAGEKSVAEQEVSPAKTATEKPVAETAEASDLEKVGERTGAFQNMVDSLRSYAGAEVEMSTNRVDIEYFVKDKSEYDLLAFAEEAKDLSPYAAMQVLSFILQNSEDPSIRLDAANLFIGLVVSYPTFLTLLDSFRADLFFSFFLCTA